jgi:DNA-directed RNA polymerase subunit RPC12/RpoP
MPQHQSTPSKSLYIDHPRCSRCGSAMWLARTTPETPDRETRTFECPVCEISVNSKGPPEKASWL